MRAPIQLIVVIILATFVDANIFRASAVDWWGDVRAQGAAEFAFYDVTYDDTLCDNELRANAVHDYIYMGTLLASLRVDTSNNCLRRCMQQRSCLAVNYYRPSTSGERGLCELLGDTQWHYPHWMRKYAGAQYFEQIHCQRGPDDSNKSLTVQEQLKFAAAPPTIASHLPDAAIHREYAASLTDFINQLMRRDVRPKHTSPASS